MNKIKKFLNKISHIERSKIADCINGLQRGIFDINSVVKLKGSKMYRARVGDYRIIFFWKEGGKIEVVDIKRRNENTYKNL